MKQEVTFILFKYTVIVYYLWVIVLILIDVVSKETSFISSKKVLLYYLFPILGVVPFFRKLKNNLKTWWNELP